MLLVLDTVSRLEDVQNNTVSNTNNMLQYAMYYYQLVQGCNNVIIVRKIITIINYFSDYNAYYTFSIHIFNNFIIFSISLGLLFYTNNMLQHASICNLRRTRPTCTLRQHVFLHQQQQHAFREYLKSE